MALTKEAIVSLAIMPLGHEPVVSFEGADNMVVAAEQAFNLLLPAVLSQSNWRFATQIQELSKLAETPPDPWKCAYLLPAGYLKTLNVSPQNYAWDIYENSKIYSQYDGRFFMEYTFVPDISKLPMHFINYFIYEIASYLALSNAQKPEYQAQLEAKRDRAFAVSSSIESQNRPQFSQASFPALNKRMLGEFIGF